MHNAIARAHRNTKEALDYQERMQWLFGMASESLLASVKRRIEGPAEKLVNDLLMVDQAYFEGHVKGTSGFADDFMNPGVGGNLDRQLRELNLDNRLFRYSCSFLIRSKAFAALPEQVREYIKRRSQEIIADPSDWVEFSHPTDEDREIMQALLDDPGQF